MERLEISGGGADADADINKIYYGYKALQHFVCLINGLHELNRGKFPKHSVHLIILKKL